MYSKAEELTRLRTDLAIESAALYMQDKELMQGVEIDEAYDEKNDIRVITVKITNEQGEQCLHKPAGTYVTLETPHLREVDVNYHEPIVDALTGALNKLVPNLSRRKILVAGIGNRKVTPDALGCLVVDHLLITRHLLKEYGQKTGLTKNLGDMSAIAPGVLGQTGMDNIEILKGLIQSTEPEILIVVDALAARSIRRLNRTIQITDTGIQPGAGVGNSRSELTEKTLGIPVIAIGIPTVIDASVIIEDAKNGVDLSEIDGLFVTPNDIDDTIGKISYTISETLNSICHRI